MRGRLGDPGDIGLGPTVEIGDVLGQRDLLGCLVQVG